MLTLKEAMIVLFMFQMSRSMQLHHELFVHGQERSQKIALMLDDQMLTFAEVMYSVQTVAIQLIKRRPRVQTDEIVYQMLQRSVELPIAYFAILTAGGVYCALNPADSASFTDQKIDQTGKSRYVLVQEATDRAMYVSRTDCLPFT